ncbi:hypothetical protein OSTOST_16483, partial [Ostertagia ostertagi]
CSRQRQSSGWVYSTTAASGFGQEATQPASPTGHRVNQTTEWALVLTCSSTPDSDLDGSVKTVETTTTTYANRSHVILPTTVQPDRAATNLSSKRIFTDIEVKNFEQTCEKEAEEAGSSMKTHSRDVRAQK